jgi:glycosyltransferase involved in cell wall biosynthesis
MKLHFYLKHFPPTETHFHEGTTQAVHGLATGLVEHGVEVVVLCEGPQPASGRSASGYQIECFPAPHSSPSFRLSPQLVDYVRDRLGADDRVILNGSFHPSLSALARLLHRQGVPYVVAPHEVYHPDMFRKNPHIKWPYWWLYEKPLLQKAAAVQMLDARQQDRLVALGIRTPTFALPNGFLPQDLVAIDAAAPATFQLAAPRFMFYGRLDAHHKGLDLLIQGFAQAALPSGSLTLQGPDGGDQAALVKLARATGRRIEFRAPNYAQPAETLLADYDVICLPSRFEGFGLVALEAMLAGRVLLVSEMAGIAPYVAASGCGRLIAPTIDGVRSGLQQLFDCREEWAAMGQRGRDYALAHLSWPHVAEQALSFYRATDRRALAPLGRQPLRSGI